METLALMAILIMACAFFAIFPVLFIGWLYVVHNNFKALSKLWWLLWVPLLVIFSWGLSVGFIKIFIYINSL